MSEQKQTHITEAAAQQAKEQTAARALLRKESAERLQAYDKHIQGMSFRQLRGELRREACKPSDTSFLTSGIAGIMLTVLENTKTLDVFEHPRRIARKDQINPYHKLHAYPR
jgi:hypothetical protein